jgi:hypothetical protein
MTAMRFAIELDTGLTWSKRWTAMGSSVGGSRWGWSDGGEAGLGACVVIRPVRHAKTTT